MNRWDNPESIFDPIVTALPPDTDWAGYGNTLIAITKLIPEARVPYTVKPAGKFKTVTELRRRMLLVDTGDDAKPFSGRVVLLDKPAAGTANIAAHRHWELAMNNPRRGLLTPAIPDDYDAATLRVSKFRIAQTGLRGAPQLALFRHLWTEAIRAASPDAICFGGQHHWDDSWWNEQDVG